jgi:predicted enzyme related to lactoylglutathione lyase
MPAMDVPSVGRMAMLADPDGAPLYVMRGASDAVSTAFSATEARHVRWNELAARDDKAALAFYADRFGWKVEGAMPMGEMGDYTFISANGVTIGAVMRAQGGGPRWTFYIGVDDIDAAVVKIASGGGEVLHGPQEIPGGEFSVHARDPHGATFGLVGPRRA